MTQVVARILTSTIYEWIVPTEQFGYGVIGEVRDAMAMAANQYIALKGERADISCDDWLKISVRDYDIVFWFEHRAERA